MNDDESFKYLDEGLSGLGRISLPDAKSITGFIFLQKDKALLVDNKLHCLNMWNSHALFGVSTLPSLDKLRVGSRRQRILMFYTSFESS